MSVSQHNRKRTGRGFCRPRYLSNNLLRAAVCPEPPDNPLELWKNLILDASKLAWILLCLNSAMTTKYDLCSRRPSSKTSSSVCAYESVFCLDILRLDRLYRRFCAFASLRGPNEIPVPMDARIDAHRRCGPLGPACPPCFSSGTDELANTLLANCLNLGRGTGGGQGDSGTISSCATAVSSIFSMGRPSQTRWFGR